MSKGSAKQNSGVAGSFDLVPGEILHKGYIGQYVYLNKKMQGIQ
ncbi:hypothetical protein B4102_4220 [Heyndrickxia sporothermodurans]|uniref:Uncharacterized protein n=1 Tax=Heyndrickxia sporothermodurans TaxID=46224 RepID=A0A150KJA2_9BACI|nr:hypothetical protein B4102_4220 [Heyndrickxia sporothermodurans]